MVKLLNSIAVLVLSSFLVSYQSCSGITVENPNNPDEDSFSGANTVSGAFFLDTIDESTFGSATVTACFSGIQALVPINALPKLVNVERVLTSLGEFSVPRSGYSTPTATIELRATCGESYSLRIVSGGEVFETADALALTGSVRTLYNPELGIHEYYVDINKALLELLETLR